MSNHTINTQQIKISVILPVYNAERSIRTSIESVFRQTFTDVQLILIDDGSSDSSGDILDEYAAHPNTVVFHQENAGVSAARNKGMELAAGKYLFFLDSDDYLDNNVLEIMWKFAEAHSLDLIACNHTEYNATVYKGNTNISDQFVAKSAEEIGRHFLDVFPKSACAKLFRRSVAESGQIRFPEEMCLGEDLYFSYSFLLKLSSMGKVANAFYRIQNINPTSLSKKYVPNMEADIKKQIAIWNKIEERYQMAKRTYYEAHMDVRIVFWAGYFNNLYKADCPFPGKEKRRLIKRYLEKNKSLLRNAGKGIKKPKNLLDRIIYMVIKTRWPVLIGSFFRIKERIKKSKFERNYRNK